MLKNIKSSYFNRILFSYIEDKQSLRLIKINKSLQRNLGISIMNYKFLPGKYVIYDTKGIGKEYNGHSDILIFEGELLNGQRNGKGKEFNDFCSIIFEGEYLKGKRNGKGKEYNDKGVLIYEGQYLNGLRNGKGKEYNDNGSLIYEGEYLKGKKMEKEKNIIS